MTNLNPFRVVAVVGLATVVLLMAACGSVSGSTSKQGQQWNDAPVVGSADESPAHVVAMPDGFNNVAWKCVRGTHSGFVVTFHGDSPYGTASHFTDPALCP